MITVKSPVIIVQTGDFRIARAWSAQTGHWRALKEEAGRP